MKVISALHFQQMTAFVHDFLEWDCDHTFYRPPAAAV
jgi:hypothetical protein